MKYLFFVGIVAFFSLLTFSCGKPKMDNRTEYDSLFLGISLGMTSKQFYDHCWEYNRKKIFIHGPTNQTVEYRISENVNSPVIMRFYPSFYEDKIFEMPVTFTYESWAPWNRQYHSDSLMNTMLHVFKKWYGEDFKPTKHELAGTVYYKLDGKRRINLYIKDDQSVRAIFTDMKMEKQIVEALKSEK